MASMPTEACAIPSALLEPLEIDPLETGSAHLAMILVKPASTILPIVQAASMEKDIFKPHQSHNHAS